MKKKTKISLHIFGLLLTAAAIGWVLTHPSATPLFWGIQLVVLTLLFGFVGFRLIYFSKLEQLREQLFQTFKILEQFEVDELSTKVEKGRGSFQSIDQLNQYLQKLIRQIQEHYHANKQFTANAAHELQTPLAIIKGNIELLIQSPRIGEKEMNAIGVILTNTNRLARLNAALILLSKIEHKRFVDLEIVNFESIIEEILENFNDLIQIQDLEIRKKYESKLEIPMSITLAEILVANLIQNAIRHNQEKGWIDIILDQHILKISNPGKVLEGEPERLFKRFKRDTNIEESLGLGLSIVKRICDHHQFKLNYIHQDGIHTLVVNFKP